MRRYFLFFLVAILLVSSGAYAKGSGKLSVSASVSAYNPPGDAGTTLLFEIAARYRVSDKITAEMSLGWTQYESGGENVTLMPIQLNGEFHPLGRKQFDPYMGAGTGVYLQKIGEEVTPTAGIQALAGVTFIATGGIKFSAELKYMLTDITDMDSGGLTMGGGIEGSWETDL